MLNIQAIPIVTAASNYSAAVDILSTSVGLASGQYHVGAAQHRVQLRVGTACFLSLITKSAAGAVLGSGMLLPKTGSAALTVNVMYIFNHQIQSDRLYNYQLSAAITNVDLTVHQIHTAQSFE